MNLIQEELKNILLEQGASLIGFAALSPAQSGEMGTGISVAAAMPRSILSSIQNGPTIDYYDHYDRANDLLDAIVTAGAKYLTAKGYRAFAQTTGTVAESEDYRTALPHKTVATRAGLGWIGKCALLVTPEYGSAIRLSSLITDAPMQCSTPVLESRCGNCMACAAACPGKAVSGRLWSAGVDRDDFFNPYECRKAARALAAERIHREITLCGQCIVACPYTKRYLNKEQPLRQEENQVAECGVL